MMTREEIKAVYDQGPERVIALVEQLWALWQTEMRVSLMIGRPLQTPATRTM